MSNWYAALGRFLGGFPERYLVCDCETQGLGVDSPATRITQLGFALVVGRRCVHSGAVMLDWTRGDAAIPAEQYRLELEATAAAMAAKGKPYHTTFARVIRDGVEPRLALTLFRDLLEDVQGRGYSMAAHNGFRFDCPLLEHHFRRYATPWAFDPERLLDSGLFEKARRMGHNPPDPGQCSLAAWYARTHRCFSRVKWSLDLACAPEYGLFERQGGDPDQVHSAGFDAELCHHLIESMRERADDPRPGNHAQDPHPS